MTCLYLRYHRGSCYPLRIPENSEQAVVHHVVASDADTGINGQITYSITGQSADELLLALRNVQDIRRGIVQQDGSAGLV